MLDEETQPMFAHERNNRALVCRDLKLADGDLKIRDEESCMSRALAAFGFTRKLFADDQVEQCAGRSCDSDNPSRRLTKCLTFFLKKKRNSSAHMKKD